MSRHVDRDPYCVRLVELSLPRYTVGVWVTYSDVRGRVLVVRLLPVYCRPITFLSVPDNIHWRSVFVIYTSENFTRLLDGGKSNTKSFNTILCVFYMVILVESHISTHRN